MFGQIISHYRSIERRMAVVVVLVALVALGHASNVYAATTTLYVSPTGLDANPCTSSLACKTIRHAISIAANGSTIRIAAGHYYENLTIGTSEGAFLVRLTLEGDGTSNTIIDGSGRGTVITVATLASVTISGVAIENGRAQNGGGITNHGILLLQKSLVSKNTGGGIFNTGRLTVMDSSVKRNSTLGSGGGVLNIGTLTVIRSTIAGNTAGTLGGGIVNTRILTVRQSTIADNRAGTYGGGIDTESDSPVILVNSTIAENSSNLDGGGIVAAGLSDLGAGVSLYNVTIALNEANTGLIGASGGGLAVYHPSFVVLHNTILSSNLVARKGFPYISFNDCEVKAFSSIFSFGYNLVSTTSGCAYFNGTGDQLGKAALLGPLQGNGGPTQTMALQLGSPAIDNGNPTGCKDQLGNLLTNDQRGDPRPHEGDGDGDNRCDIGAYEK